MALTRQARCEHQNRHSRDDEEDASTTHCEPRRRQLISALFDTAMFYTELPQASCSRPARCCTASHDPRDVSGDGAEFLVQIVSSCRDDVSDKEGSEVVHLEYKHLCRDVQKSCLISHRVRCRNSLLSYGLAPSRTCKRMFGSGQQYDLHSDRRDASKQKRV